MNQQMPTITMREETDPVEIAKARERRAKFDLNDAWLKAHASEVFSHRDKFYCICGQQAFIADSAEEALAQAQAAHPPDDERITGYIPKERSARIYLPKLGRFISVGPPVPNVVMKE